MRLIARALATVLLVVLAAAACSTSVLTDSEQEWCTANPTAVLDFFGSEFAGQAVVNDFADAYIAAMGDEPPEIGAFLRDNYREEYEQSCQAAYAGR